MENYNKELEKNLVDMAKQKEEADRKLLNLEIVMGVACIIVMLGLCAIAAYVQMQDWLRIVLIVIGFVPFLIACPYLLMIEQTAGYYECAKCGHKYVPKYKSVFFSMHMGRTRYMKCPECGEKSWQKKRLSK